MTCDERYLRNFIQPDSNYYKKNGQLIAGHHLVYLIKVDVFLYMFQKQAEAQWQFLYLER